MAWYFNGNYPWVGVLFCAPIIGLWYWCTDQYIVQRVLSAQNETDARRGSICASALKLLPVFIFIIPGMICFALAQSGQSPILRQALFDQSGQLVRDNAQQAFPLLVAHVLPMGVRGIVVAGLLAALMSSLAGAFNACAALFTIDFYSKVRPQATEKQVVWVGRVATAVMVLIALLWIPIIRGGRGLYDYLQGIQAYLAPPIFVVFFFGVFWRRLNAKGCLWALVVGFAMGLFRLSVDTPVKLLGNFTYAEGSFLWIVFTTTGKPVESPTRARVVTAAPARVLLSPPPAQPWISSPPFALTSPMPAGRPSGITGSSPTSAAPGRTQPALSHCSGLLAPSRRMRASAAGSASEDSSL
jgi:SSS family solute:Na+ symporter